jgi:hypothetical protein
MRFTLKLVGSKSDGTRWEVRERVLQHSHSFSEDLRIRAVEKTAAAIARLESGAGGPHQDSEDEESAFSTEDESDHVPDPFTTGPARSKLAAQAFPSALGVVKEIAELISRRARSRCFK